MPPSTLPYEQISLEWQHSVRVLSGNKCMFKLDNRGREELDEEKPKESSFWVSSSGQLASSSCESGRGRENSRTCLLSVPFLSGGSLQLSPVVQYFRSILLSSFCLPKVNALYWKPKKKGSHSWNPCGSLFKTQNRVLKVGRLI